VSTRPRVGVSIPTMGTRPNELAALIASIKAQYNPPERIVVAGNGADVPDLPDDVEYTRLPDNTGIPEGKNATLRILETGEAPDIILYLDDDCRLTDLGMVNKIRDMFADEPTLGIVGFRIQDEHGDTQRRHIPRLRKGDPARPSYVTTFLGGAHAMRTAVHRTSGDWPGQFFYAHEETDMAWRALDAGWDIAYRPELTLYHPRTAPTRHADFHLLTARNRVWLARRRLPWPVIPIYLLSWTVSTVLRTRNPRTLSTWIRGFIKGWTTPCGDRAPMRWATIWRMTRLGRPPIV
jgi:GT2 family glycosyltransferase